MAKNKWRGFRSQREQIQQHQTAAKASPVMNPAIQQQQQIKLERFYTGPIPEPQALAAYEQIAVGLANRIVTMAEKEQNHRHLIERRRNRAQAWTIGAGQVFGFLLALFIIGIAGWLLAHDKAITGFASLLTGIATLVGPFIYQRKRAAQNSESVGSSEIAPGERAGASP